MTRRSNFLPFLFATATSAVTVAAAIQYRRQKAAALQQLAAHSSVAQTALGPVEVAVAGEGEPALVIHGAPGSYTQGLVVGEALVDAGYQVIAPSRFGYLRSPLPSDASPAAQADALAALLDTLNISQPVVALGVSGGGPTAVEFVIRHPRRASALIMMAAVSQPRDVYAEERTSAMSMLEFGINSDIAMWLMLHYTVRTIPIMVAQRPTLQILLARPELMAMYRRLVWALWPVSVLKAGIDNDIAQFKRLNLPLKKVSVPTLVLHGTDDQLVSYETGVFTASQIPGAKFLGYERGEHGLFVTQYDEVWPPLLDFLQSTKKAAPKKSPDKKPSRPAKPKKPAARRPAPTKPAPKRKRE